MIKCVYYISAARGLGQISRSMKISIGLQNLNKNMTFLFISGSPNISLFKLPENSEYVILPKIIKDDNDNFASTNNLDDTLKKRRELIFKTITNYKPHFFFIDRNPIGIGNELLDIIKSLKNSSETKIYFITRDIIDDNSKVIDEWNSLDYYTILEKYFNNIFILGENSIYNFVDKYQLTKKIAFKTIYCGYLKASNIDEKQIESKSSMPQILVTVGSGIDGFEIIENFIKVYPKLKESYSSLSAIIILGPSTPIDFHIKILNQVQKHKELQVLNFTTRIIELMQHSELVISMAGYNTTSEILALKKKAILIPRTKPTKEQLIRSKLLDKMGFITSIHPKKLSPQIMYETIISTLIKKQSNYNLSSDAIGIIFNIINPSKPINY